MAEPPLQECLLKNWPKKALKKKLKMNFFSGWGKGNNSNEARHNAEKAYQ